MGKVVFERLTWGPYDSWRSSSVSPRGAFTPVLCGDFDQMLGLDRDKDYKLEVHDEPTGYELRFYGGDDQIVELHACGSSVPVSEGFYWALTCVLEFHEARRAAPKIHRTGYVSIHFLFTEVA